VAGGKGANLGELIRAGQPVPPGFCVVTDAYVEFLRENGLTVEIDNRARAARDSRGASLERLSEEIRSVFTAGRVPSAIAEQVSAAYLSLGGPRLAVAVRSSATAEDLPDTSFAGQQDTYLNTVGERALMDAMVRCWASLWTARAIGYRSRNDITDADVALAVVVQVMVESESSGVLFTANPLTGRRRETVIDATFGLGEALVSGQVEPDHYVVEDGRITARTLGAKALSTRSLRDGGTVSVGETGAGRQALPDAGIVELERRGRQIEAHFGAPQDIEWAWVDSRLSILQSRPITSLYPRPSGVSDDELLVLFSLAGIQGMFDPFTPLGSDLFRSLIVMFGRIFGLDRTVDSQRGFFVAGSRLWLNFTPLFRKRIGRRILSVIVDFIDPGSRAAVDRLFVDPRFSPAGRVKLRTVRGFARIFSRIGPRVLANLISPERGRTLLFERIEAMATGVAARCGGAKTLAELLDVLETAMDSLPPVFFGTLIPAVASGQAAQGLLRAACDGLPDRERWIMQIARGLPFNVTTEMDLALWEAARSVRRDPAAAREIADTDPADLAARYKAGTLPLEAQTAIARFLERYGARAVGEIDIGRPRWREDPATLFQALSSYLRITDETTAPDEMFRRGAASAERAAEELLVALRGLPGGRRRVRRARFAISRVRGLVGLRESPKFAAIRVFSFMREGLLSSGGDLQRAGIVDDAHDVFSLLLSELRAIAAGETRDWKRLVIDRRREYERERRRRMVPRLMLSDGTAFYEGVGGAGAAGDDGHQRIPGSPVSPGVAEGPVRVVLDPRSAGLEPGEILVCVGTDPAWTPLFLAAGGLVMEVGGMMTHGSVVAREYGIPAVVGVTGATTRLSTGQRIRVDGNTGTVTVL
jgi:pyruvate,water dikinase